MITSSISLNTKPRRWCHIAEFMLLVVTVALFVMAQHTVRIPPNQIHTVFTCTTLQGIAAGIAGLAVAYLVCMILRQYLFTNAETIALFRPLYGLIIYPITVFILFPLRVPDPLLIFVHQDVLLWLCLALMGYTGILLVSDNVDIRKYAQQRFKDISPRFLASSVFVVFLAVFAIATRIDNRESMIVGDEPHYLLIMQGLEQVRTADLSKISHEVKLANGVRRIRPHKSDQSVKGSIYSVHQIGLPLLLIIPHLIGGFNGVMFFFNIIAALVVANMFLLAFDLTRCKWLSLAAALLMGFSCPIIFYFRSIYPDMPAALLVVFAYRVVRKTQPGILALAVAGIAAAYLPWLHAKYTVISCSLAVLYLVTFLRSRFMHRQDVALNLHVVRSFCEIWRLLVFLLPFIASALLLMWFFLGAYGSWLPNAQYGSASPPFSRFFFRGAPGLFFDRDHGLLAFAPFYVFALSGMVVMARSHRADFYSMAFLVLPSFVAFSSHWMWWGGPCPPGRFILPMLPLAAPALVLCWRDFRHPLCRFIFILLAAVTIALSLISLRIPGSLPLHRHFIRDFIPSLAAFSHLPLFFVHRSKPVPWLSYQTLACWAVPILVLIAYSVRASRQPSQVDNFTDQKNKRLGSFAFLSICLYLFWGGMCSYVNYIGDDKIHTLNEPQNLSLDAFGYHLKLYVEPIEKSGTNPEVFNREISPPVELHTSIPVDKMIRLASMPDRGLSHEHFLTRQYLTLYPVCYSVTFHLTAVGVAGETMGTVDVSIDNGEQTLYSMDIQAQNTAVSVPMEMVFRPDRILYGAKFSCCISAPGKITIHRIDVKARLGDCFGAF